MDPSPPTADTKTIRGIIVVENDLKVRLKTHSDSIPGVGEPSEDKDLVLPCLYVSFDRGGIEEVPSGDAIVTEVTSPGRGDSRATY